MNNKSIIILKHIMSWKYDCILLFIIWLYFIIHNSSRWEFEAWLHFCENINFVVNLLGRQSTGYIHWCLIFIYFLRWLLQYTCIYSRCHVFCVCLIRLYEFHCCIDYITIPKHMNCNLSCCDVGVFFTLLFILHHYRSLWNLTKFY